MEINQPSSHPPSSQEHILFQAQSQLTKAKVNASHCMKKAEETRDALRKCQKLMTTQEQQLADGQQELAELEKAWSSYEKQVQQQGALSGRDIELDRDQVSQTTKTLPLSYKVCFSSSYHWQRI